MTISPGVPVSVEGGEAPYYVPSMGPSSRPRRTLKQGDVFAVLDSFGEIGVSAGGADGIFSADTRRLSYLGLAIDGRQLLLLDSRVLDDNAGLVVDLTNPDIYVDGRLILPKDTLHVVRFQFLWNGALHERCSIQNHGSEAVTFTLSIAFGCDFADLFEVRGMRRKARGRLLDPWVSGDRVALAYRGLDGIDRRTELYFRPAPQQLDGRSAVYEIVLEPGGRMPIFTTISSGEQTETARRPFLGGLQKARRASRLVAQRGAEVATSSERINGVFGRSLADLRMLLTETTQGSYPYAGIPWYSTTFGRDGIITAIEALWVDPEIARGVLMRLAAFQATGFDAASDAEPGKILHEMRGGEMAILGEVPFGLYYGSVDSTPLFVLLAGLYYERTNDLATVDGLWPAIEAALGWIDGPADPDGDGFIEYHRATDSGLVNQGWKDSYDSIFHADGSLAEGPVAVAEAQAYVYAAKRAAATLARALGKDAVAVRLGEEAERLAERFDEAFWCEEIGSYALALDGRKRQCRVVSSNAAHVLFAGLARQDRAERVAARLMGADAFSGWGIRTIAWGSARYNPMSYHNGSVWPHDNALAALGFGRYGLASAVVRTTDAIIDAAASAELCRLPELYCGFRRKSNRGPTLYPVACSPQAWAAGAPLALLQACLGMSFDPRQGEVRLARPILPAAMEHLTIRRLALGSSRLDIRVDRSAAGVSAEIVSRTGPGEVRITDGP
ncbi:MAG: amylo-alpha-1,6-glucosidase [Bauldia sp.]|nr:amylo-alpha-1,6-glucosidase [Bauldia sp.]